MLQSFAGSRPAFVSTNAPVLRWPTRIDLTLPHLGPTAVLSLRVNVTGTNAFWSTGDIRQNVLSSWQGLAVYEGPGLTANATYDWTAEERVVAYSNGTAGPATFELAGSGSFVTSPTLRSARLEAAAAMTAPNITALWNGSWQSVATRLAPSGFLPTSVSGGYGGITQEFVRDASGQLIGLLQLGPAQYSVVGRALRFMLSSLQAAYAPGSYLSYAPHVMHADKASDRTA